MPIWLEKIILSPWFVFATFIVGIGGVVATVVTYLGARFRRDVSFITKSHCLINNRYNPHTRLKFTYDKQKIGTFTVFKIAIWNRGNVSLRSSDRVAGSPLQIVLSEGRILEVIIVRESNSSNSIKLNLGDATAVQIEFDYLDHRDGIVAEIRHTSPDAKALSVEGKLVGVPLIKRRFEFDPLIIYEMAAPFRRPTGSRNNLKWSRLIAVIIVGVIVEKAARILIADGGEKVVLGYLLVASTGCIYPVRLVDLQAFSAFPTRRLGRRLLRKLT